MPVDQKLNNIEYEIGIYRTRITTWKYMPRNLDDLKAICDRYEESLGHTNIGIELSYDRWNDKYISKIGAMLMTPVIFITEDDFAYMCRHSKEFRQSIDLCGKDQLYLKFAFNEYLNEELLDVVEDIKTRIEGFNSIYDVIQYCIKVGTGGKSSISITDFSDVIHNHFDLLLKDKRNSQCYIAVYLIKIFSLYNRLMNHNEFLKNKNTGFIGLLSDSLFISNMNEDRYYSDRTVKYFMDRLSSYVTYYKDIAETRIDNEEYEKCVPVDHYSRYIVFDQDFINDNIQNISTVVSYGEQMFCILEDERQIDAFKSMDGPIAGYNVLFVKELDKKYKRSLLKAGAGGYDTIEMCHL